MLIIQQPSIEVEMRYQEGKLDMGIFGPENMVTVDEAEVMIESFIEFLA